VRYAGAGMVSPGEFACRRRALSVIVGHRGDSSEGAP
jgi:hypothetical protein